MMPVEIKAEESSTLSKMSNENNKTDDYGIEPLSFPMYSEKLTASNGLEYNISLDARDSMFGDDILIKFNTVFKQKVIFKISVTFYYTAQGGGSKGLAWTLNGNSGSQLLNSGRTSVTKMECTWTIEQDGIQVEKRTYTFNEK